MKGSLTVVAFFCAGCLMGVANDFRFDLHDLSMYVLYALMFQVGIGIGSNNNSFSFNSGMASKAIW